MLQNFFPLPRFARWSVRFLVAMFLSCSGPLVAAERMNVLLIVADDQRPDTIRALGNMPIETPTLDQLARDGTVFTRATCANPLCVPSRAELLSGLNSFHSGFFATGGLRQDAVLWPQVMRQAGYRTCYVGKWHTRGRPSTCGFDEVDGLFSSGKAPQTPQLDRHGRPVTGYVGWQFQTDDRVLHPEQGIGVTPDISSKFADAAIRLLKQPHDKPFFLQVNFTAPHDPLYFPPSVTARELPPLPVNFLAEHPFDHGNLRGRDELLLPFPRRPADVRDELAVYYAVIEELDRQVGRILSTLADHGLRDNTLVIYTSDHGLAIGSHGLRGKQNMYEHTINVPLIVRGPGIAAGQRLATQCYLRDLFPTVCELVGVPVPDMDGRSLVPALQGSMTEIHPFIVGYFGDSQRMIRASGWKLIHYPKADRRQLFHVATDPQELHDLSADAEQADRIADLQRKLDEWLREAGKG